MLKQHDVKNILGHHPFAIEDVMIGRMHMHMKSISKHSQNSKKILPMKQYIITDRS